jgi:hypothetical protein
MRHPEGILPLSAHVEGRYCRARQTQRPFFFLVVSRGYLWATVPSVKPTNNSLHVPLSQVWFSWGSLLVATLVLSCFIRSDPLEQGLEEC